MTRNGQVSKLDAALKERKTIASLDGWHVERVLRVKDRLFAVTSAGSMFTTLDGDTWETVSTSYARLFVDADGQPMLMTTRELVAYRNVGQTLEADTLQRFGFSVLPYAFAFRNDTVLTTDENSDSVFVYVSGSFVHASRIPTESVSRFIQLANGTILGLTRFGALYAEPSAGISGSTWRSLSVDLQRVQSVSRCRDQVGECALVVGIDLENKPVIKRIGSVPMDITAVPIADSIQSRFAVAIATESAITIASESGMITRIGQSGVNRMLPTLPDVFRRLNREVTSWRGRPAIFATLVHDSTNARSFAIVQDDDTYMPLANEAQGLRDSLGELRYFYETPDGAEIAVFSSAVVRRARQTDGWLRVHTFRARVSTLPNGIVLDDSMMVLPHSGRTVAISRNQGRTWTTHTLRGSLGYTQCHASKLQIVFTSDFKVSIIPRVPIADTIQPLAYEFGFVSSLQTLAVDTSSITVAYCRSTFDTTLLQVDRVCMLQLTPNATAIDSIVVSISPPLKGRSMMSLFGDTLAIWCRDQDRFLLVRDGSVLRDIRIPVFTEPFRQNFTTIATIESTNRLTLSSPIFDAITTLGFAGDSVTSVTISSKSRQTASMTVQPNPATDVVSIRIAQGATDHVHMKRLELFDIRGFVVRDFSSLLQSANSGSQYQLIEIHVSDIPAGTFFVVLKDGRSMHAQRITICH